MAIFSRWALTDQAKQLITKAQAEKCTIHFTRARTGDGRWADGESLRTAEDIKNQKQAFEFSSVDIPDGNPATVVLEIVINNLDLDELYYLNEMGIYAENPDGGELLYCILVSDTQAVYVPANNGIGISTITERVNLEVADSANVTIDTTGAVVAASDFIALRTLVTTLRRALAGGIEGQHLIKIGDLDYQMQWVNFAPVITRPFAEFPEYGQTNALYVDTDSSEIYFWIDNEESGYYFKLPLGAEASQTLQLQITANKNAIAAVKSLTSKLETATFAEREIEIAADGWKATTESGVTIYTAEVAIEGVTEESDITVWPGALSSDAAVATKEMKAQATFFAKGRAYADTGKVIFKCFAGVPTTILRIRLQGVA
ncbi:MAG: phage tail protein [Lachnospiraceae bacterium]|nr:phage tail protein [Lachnospiraceae bacterium]